MDWEALAREIVARRVELGHTSRQTFVDASGLSARTVGDLETARRDSYARETLVRLERALGWASGSARAVLSGDHPTAAPIPPSAPDQTDGIDTPLALVAESDLPPHQKTALYELAAWLRREQRAERDQLHVRHAAQVEALAQTVEALCGLPDGVDPAIVTGRLHGGPGAEVEAALWPEEAGRRPPRPGVAADDRQDAQTRR